MNIDLNDIIENLTARISILTRESAIKTAQIIALEKEIAETKSAKKNEQQEETKKPEAE